MRRNCIAPTTVWRLFDVICPLGVDNNIPISLDDALTSNTAIMALFKIFATAAEASNFAKTLYVRSFIRLVRACYVRLGVVALLPRLRPNGFKSVSTTLLSKYALSTITTMQLRSCYVQIAEATPVLCSPELGCAFCL